MMSDAMGRLGWRAGIAVAVAVLWISAAFPQNETNATSPSINKEIPAGLLPSDSSTFKEPAVEKVLESAEYVRLAWAASSQNQADQLNKLVDACLAHYGEAALKQEARLQDFPQRGTEGDYQALNDVATMLFIKAEYLMNHGKTDDAIALFQKIIEEYKWSKAWDPRGWFWSVAEKSQASIDVMLGKIREDEDKVLNSGPRTQPYLATAGTAKVINYLKYGEFEKVGTKDYRYILMDPKGLSEAVGEGIYPNTGAVLKNPRLKQLQAEGRLEGSHWDFVHSNDMEAAFLKWATAKEPWGIKLFYIGMLFEKAGRYYDALKAYHALIVHFSNSVGWTYWQTPWYPAQAAIAKIKHILRTHPELNLKTKYMKIIVKNGFDNDISNDEIITYPGVIEEKNFWDQLVDRFQWEPKKVKLEKIVKRVGSGKVQLVQYDNGHWQMLVDGKPYVIKGMNYSPIKVGQSPDKGTLVNWMTEDINNNGLVDGPYDSWVDKNGNNEQDPDEPVIGDFQLMKDMGVNTIREYHQPFESDKKLMREMYDKYGIRLILGDFLGKYTLGSGAPWSEGTNYENPEHQKNMMASVRKMVMEYKDEPYILLWVLGNENNYGIASNADKKPEAYFRFVNEVAKMIKTIDPDHPVAICNGDTLFLDIFAKYAPDVDIFAANVYRGDYGFGSYWEQVVQAAGKPAFVTEYGAPAFAQHLSKEEAEEAQANYHRGNWGDIEANIAGMSEGIGNAIGGVAFEWTDEWWKNYEPFYHDRKSDAIGPFPGGYYYEEWFGLTSQGNGRHSPFLRQLRKSYFAYKEMWNKPAGVEK